MQELFQAIYNSNISKVKSLLAARQNIDAPLWHDFNALLYAVFRNELEIAKVLIEIGANVNYIVPFNTYTPTIVEPDANFISSEPITAELFQAMQDLGNISALHIAVKQNNFNIAKLLLENGAFVDVTDQGGCTPLHWAVSQDNEALVALLLRNKAKSNIIDMAGSTPVAEANRRKHASIVQLLTTRPH